MPPALPGDTYRFSPSSVSSSAANEALDPTVEALRFSIAFFLPINLVDVLALIRTIASTY